VFLAAYTDDMSELPIEDVYPGMSSKINGSYFTGQPPPFTIEFHPFFGVVDLETMEPIEIMEFGALDVELHKNLILAAVNLANDD
jgi:hypothetical protein